MSVLLHNNNEEMQIQMNSDNELLSDISAYNSDNDNEDTEAVAITNITTTTVINPVFDEINCLLNNLQMDSTNYSNDDDKMKVVSNK